MARIRSIKPSAPSSASLIRCSKPARLLFTWSWCFFDDDGVHPADPWQLKAEVFPGDSDSEQQVQEWVDELIAQDCLALFEVPASEDPALKHFAGRKFWICVNWHHQKIDHPTPTRAPIRALWLASQGISDSGRNAFRALPAAPADSGAVADPPALWPQATLWARERFIGLGLAAKGQDRSLALKICYLIITGRLPEEWLSEAVKSIKKAQAHPKKDKACRPGALLMQIFKNKCSEAKPPLDFRRLLAECPEPPAADATPAAPSPSPVAAASAAASPPSREPFARKILEDQMKAAAKPPPADDAGTKRADQAERQRQIRLLEAEARREAAQKKSA